MTTVQVLVRLPKELAEWAKENAEIRGFRNRTELIRGLIEAAKDGRLRIAPKPSTWPEAFPAEHLKKEGPYRGPLSGREFRLSEEEAEEVRVQVLAHRTVGFDGCWRHFPYRYGSATHFSIRLQTRTVGCVKAACAAWHGDIPQGSVIRHSCDNSDCFNPFHLSIGTQKENMQDRASRKRMKAPPTDYINEELERCRHWYGIALEDTELSHIALMECWSREGVFASRYTLLRYAREYLGLTKDPPNAETFGPWRE